MTPITTTGTCFPSRWRNLSVRQQLSYWMKTICNAKLSSCKSVSSPKQQNWIKCAHRPQTIQMPIIAPESQCVELRDFFRRKSLDWRESHKKNLFRSRQVKNPYVRVLCHGHAWFFLCVADKTWSEDENQGIDCYAKLREWLTLGFYFLKIVIDFDMFLINTPRYSIQIFWVGNICKPLWQTQACRLLSLEGLVTGLVIIFVWLETILSWARGRNQFSITKFITSIKKCGNSGNCTPHK